MAALQQFCETITVSLATGPDIIDVSDKLSACIGSSCIIHGVVSAFSEAQKDGRCRKAASARSSVTMLYTG